MIPVYPGCFVCLCGGSNQLDHIYNSYPTKSSLPDLVPQSPHPQFVYSHSANVSTILHKTAHLNCRIKGVGNKTVKLNLCSFTLNMLYQVTWIRHRDTHLLTAGRYRIYNFLAFAPKLPEFEVNPNF